MMISMQCLIFCVVSCTNLFHHSFAYRKLDWWETTLMYQLYPRSFKDTNGDGIGDLNGVYEKLDYLKDVGFETIWIQPFYKSPNSDMGYDVSDYRAVDPMFGTMDDFKKLVKGIHDRGMKLVIDYVPNHTSDEHEWFKLSEDRVAPYTDYFLWKEPRNNNKTHPIPPNNWISVFSGSSWEWSPKREQYYYHAFGKKQPDLDYRNPNVRQAMADVLRFWLDLGVDGFRCDAVLWMVEAEHFMDEPARANAADFLKESWRTLDHIYSYRQPDNYGVTHEWRLVMDEYKRRDGHTRLLTIEAVLDIRNLLLFLGNSTHPGVHHAYNYDLNFVSYETNATFINQIVQKWIGTLPPGKLPNWVLDSHDVKRTTFRDSPDSIDSYSMLALLLPGMSCIYYGTEIGLEDSQVRANQRQDPFVQVQTQQSRDSCRGPMLWDDTKNAGFTTNDVPWLPVQPNYWRTNVKRQLEEPKSHLNIFKRLTALRKTDVIKHGETNSYVLDDWVYMLTRTLGEELIAVIVNLGSESRQICAKEVASELPDTMFVHTSSLNAGFEIGDKVTVSGTKGTCAELRPKAGLVLSTSSSTVYKLSPLLAMLAVGFNLFWRTRIC